MSENSEQTGRGWARYVVWTAILLICYPLSMGPFVWTSRTLDLDPLFGNKPQDRAVRIAWCIYMPLELIPRDTSLYKAQEWYLSLWVSD